MNPVPLSAQPPRQRDRGFHFSGNQISIIKMTIELDSQPAEEIALFTQDGQLPSQLPLGTPQRFWSPFLDGFSGAPATALL